MVISEGVYPQLGVVIFALRYKGKMHQCLSDKLGISHSRVHRVSPGSMAPLSAPQHVRQLLLDRSKICEKPGKLTMLHNFPVLWECYSSRV